MPSQGSEDSDYWEAHANPSAFIDAHGMKRWQELMSKDPMGKPMQQKDPIKGLKEARPK
jgi:hypothetical protein